MENSKDLKEIKFDVDDPETYFDEEVALSYQYEIWFRNCNISTSSSHYSRQRPTPAAGTSGADTTSLRSRITNQSGLNKTPQELFEEIWNRSAASYFNSIEEEYYQNEIWYNYFNGLRSTDGSLSGRNEEIFIKETVIRNRQPQGDTTNFTEDDNTQKKPKSILKTPDASGTNSLFEESSLKTNEEQKDRTEGMKKVPAPEKPTNESTKPVVEFGGTKNNIPSKKPSSVSGHSALGVIDRPPQSSNVNINVNVIDNARLSNTSGPSAVVSLKPSLVQKVPESKPEKIDNQKPTNDEVGKDVRDNKSKSTPAAPVKESQSPAQTKQQSRPQTTNVQKDSPKTTSVITTKPIEKPSTDRPQKDSQPVKEIPYSIPVQKEQSVSPKSKSVTTKPIEKPSTDRSQKDLQIVKEISSSISVQKEQSVSDVTTKPIDKPSTESPQKDSQPIKEIPPSKSVQKKQSVSPKSTSVTTKPIEKPSTDRPQKDSQPIKQIPSSKSAQKEESVSSRPTSVTTKPIRKSGTDRTLEDSQSIKEILPSKPVQKKQNVSPKSASVTTKPIEKPSTDIPQKDSQPIKQIPSSKPAQKEESVSSRPTSVTTKPMEKPSTDKPQKDSQPIKEIPPVQKEQSVSSKRPSVTTKSMEKLSTDRPQKDSQSLKEIPPSKPIQKEQSVTPKPPGVPTKPIEKPDRPQKDSQPIKEIPPSKSVQKEQRDSSKPTGEAVTTKSIEKPATDRPNKDSQYLKEIPPSKPVQKEQSDSPKPMGDVVTTKPIEKRSTDRPQKESQPLKEISPSKPVQKKQSVSPKPMGDVVTTKPIEKRSTDRLQKDSQPIKEIPPSKPVQKEQSVSSKHAGVTAKPMEKPGTDRPQKDSQPIQENPFSALVPNEQRDSPKPIESEAPKQDTPDLPKRGIIKTSRDQDGIISSVKGSQISVPKNVVLVDDKEISPSYLPAPCPCTQDNTADKDLSVSKNSPKSKDSRKKKKSVTTKSTQIEDDDLPENGNILEPLNSISTQTINSCNVGYLCEDDCPTKSIGSAGSRRSHKPRRSKCTRKKSKDDHSGDTSTPKNKDKNKDKKADPCPCPKDKTQTDDLSESENSLEPFNSQSTQTDDYLLKDRHTRRISKRSKSKTTLYKPQPVISPESKTPTTICIPSTCEDTGGTSLDQDKEVPLNEDAVRDSRPDQQSNDNKSSKKPSKKFKCFLKLGKKKQSINSRSTQTDDELTENDNPSEPINSMSTQTLNLCDVGYLCDDDCPTELIRLAGFQHKPKLSKCFQKKTKVKKNDPSCPCSLSQPSEPFDSETQTDDYLLLDRNKPKKSKCSKSKTSKTQAVTCPGSRTSSTKCTSSTSCADDRKGDSEIPKEKDEEVSVNENVAPLMFSNPSEPATQTDYVLCNRPKPKICKCSESETSTKSVPAPCKEDRSGDTRDKTKDKDEEIPVDKNSSCPCPKDKNPPKSGKVGKKKKSLNSMKSVNSTKSKTCLCRSQTDTCPGKTPSTKSYKEDHIGETPKDKENLVNENLKRASCPCSLEKNPPKSKSKKKSNVSMTSVNSIATQTGDDLSEYKSLGDDLSEIDNPPEVLNSISTQTFNYCDVIHLCDDDCPNKSIGAVRSQHRHKPQLFKCCKKKTSISSKSSKANKNDVTCPCPASQPFNSIETQTDEYLVRDRQPRKSKCSKSKTSVNCPGSKNPSTKSMPCAYDRSGDTCEILKDKVEEAPVSKSACACTQDKNPRKSKCCRKAEKKKKSLDSMKSVNSKTCLCQSQIVICPESITPSEKSISLAPCKPQITPAPGSKNPSTKSVRIALYTDDPSGDTGGTSTDKEVNENGAPLSNPSELARQTDNYELCDLPKLRICKCSESQTSTSKPQTIPCPASKPTTKSIRSVPCKKDPSKDTSDKPKDKDKKCLCPQEKETSKAKCCGKSRKKKKSDDSMIYVKCNESITTLPQIISCPGSKNPSTKSTRSAPCKEDRSEEICGKPKDKDKSCPCSQEKKPKSKCFGKSAKKKKSHDSITYVKCNDSLTYLCKPRTVICPESQTPSIKSMPNVICRDDRMEENCGKLVDKVKDVPVKVSSCSCPQVKKPSKSKCFKKKKSYYSMTSAISIGTQTGDDISEYDNLSGVELSDNPSEPFYSVSTQTLNRLCDDDCTSKHRQKPRTSKSKKKPFKKLKDEDKTEDENAAQDPCSCPSTSKKPSKSKCFLKKKKSVASDDSDSVYKFPAKSNSFPEVGNKERHPGELRPHHDVSFYDPVNVKNNLSDNHSIQKTESELQRTNYDGIADQPATKKKRISSEPETSDPKNDTIILGKDAFGTPDNNSYYSRSSNPNRKSVNTSANVSRTESRSSGVEADPFNYNKYKQKGGSYPFKSGNTPGYEEPRGTGIPVAIQPRLQPKQDDMFPQRNNQNAPIFYGSEPFTSGLPIKEFGVRRDTGETQSNRSYDKDSRKKYALSDIYDKNRNVEKALKKDKLKTVNASEDEEPKNKTGKKKGKERKGYLLFPNKDKSEKDKSAKDKPERDKSLSPDNLSEESSTESFSRPFLSHYDRAFVSRNCCSKIIDIQSTSKSKKSQDKDNRKNNKDDKSRDKKKKYPWLY